MSKYKIYCDMDGVLVDFDKGYLKLTGQELGREHRTDTDFWDPINKAGYDFWINLDWVYKELPGVNLILRSAKHKKDFAGPNCILIDDRIDNIQGWRDAGGIGIHHINTKHTIDQLKVLDL